MRATFVELPPFERKRKEYLDDSSFQALQEEMLKNPQAGDVIKDTGGLRKLRFTDKRRGKGKRGGLRVIYYWWIDESQFLLFTVYDKDEMSDLSPDERKKLGIMLGKELKARITK